MNFRSSILIPEAWLPAILPCCLLLGIGALVAFLRRSNPLYRWLVPALFVRMLAGCCYAALALWLYPNGSDITEYYRAIRLLHLAIAEQPDGWTLLFAHVSDTRLPYHLYFTQGASWEVVRLGAALAQVWGVNFWSLQLGFASLGFVGSWLLFRSLHSYLPARYRLAAWIALFFPSLLVWGSGLGKGAVTAALLTTALAAIIRVLSANRIRWNWAIIIGLTGMGLLLLKSYLWAGLLVGGSAVGTRRMWRGLRRGSKLWVALGIGAGCVALATLGFDQIDALRDHLSWTIENRVFRDARSAYRLPAEAPLSWAKLVLLAPWAVGTTLFRPLPTEWTGSLVAVAGVEALGVIGVNFWLGIQIARGRHRVPDLSLWLLVAFGVGAFAVGLLSGNFGTLMRYRAPLLLMELLGLWVWYANERNRLLS